jgi:hypothetical protein
VESSCKLGNEPSGSIKCWETTEWLHNLWPLERDSAPQSWLVSYILFYIYCYYIGHCFIQICYEALDLNLTLGIFLFLNKVLSCCSTIRLVDGSVGIVTELWTG